MTQDSHIPEHKERRAFRSWILGALLVLVAAIAIGAYVLDTHGNGVNAGQTSQPDKAIH